MAQAPDGDDTLGVDDAGDILEEILPVQSKSYQFGLKLKLPQHVVETIHSENLSPVQYLFEIIIAFLQQRGKLRPTWRVIIDALRSPSVGLTALANTVEAAHFPNPTATPSHPFASKLVIQAPDGNDTLTPDDAVNIMEELLAAQNHAKLLGLMLNVKPRDVEAINNCYKHPREQLLHIILAFLQQAELRPTWRAIVDALRSPVVGLTALANKIESNHFPNATASQEAVPKSTDEEDRKYFEEAMLKGYVESGESLVILVGVTGSGKTEFKRIVLGQKVPKYSRSTSLTARPISLCNVAVKGVQWEFIDPKRMLAMVAEKMKIKDWQSKSGENTHPSESAAKEGDGKIIPTPSTSNTHVELEQSQEESSRSPMVEQKHDVTNLNKDFLGALGEINLDSELIETMKKDNIGEESLMGVDFIYLLDSGGQPPFREMLPHFVQQASAIVLMQKLNERLDFQPTIRYREKGGKVDQGYKSQLTNEQILHQYVQGVQSHRSKVFVIGTHSDIEQDCKTETRNEKNKKLLKAFCPVIGEQMELYKMRRPRQLIFPLNCTSRKPKDMKIAKLFQERIIQNCMGKKKKIPLPWFVLKQLLRLIAEEMQVSVLSVEECCVAAQKKLHMPPDACKAALRHLSSLNILFYRPNILPSVVFTRAQVIIDKLTELVRCNHALRTEEAEEDSESTDGEEKDGGETEKSASAESNTTDSSDSSDQEASPSEAIPPCINNYNVQRFEECGVVDSEFLEKAFPSHYREGLFTSPDLLRLLEGMLIAGRLNSGEHFIPSLLPDLPLEEIAEFRGTAEHPPPLIIYYPNMWLPVGVMSSLVVYLQNECNWVPSTKYNEPTCMKHNCIEFDLPENEAGSIVLIDSFKFLELHVKPFLRVNNHLFHRIKNNVCIGLQKAHKSLHYDHPNVEIGFLCSGDQCKVSEAHIATVVNNKLKCSIDSRYKAELSKEQQTWMEKSSSESVEEQENASPSQISLLDERNLYDVKKALVATHRWKDIGLALGLDLGQLKKIEKQYSDPNDCLSEMLEPWLKKNYNTKKFGDPSWKTLARAVRDPAGGNDSALADTILKQHTEMEKKLTDAESTSRKRSGSLPSGTPSPKRCKKN